MKNLLIFLLKRNVRPDIIHTIIAYPPEALPETYDGWKSAILSVGQERESVEFPRRDIRTSTETTYGG